EVKTVAILTFVGIAIFATASAAAVYHSRESALELAFGQDAEVSSQELFLSKQEQAAAGKLAGSDIPSRLIRRYEGRQDGQLLGYAYFETHLVRSLPETLMIVVDPAGRVIGVHMLAFHEPEEYLPRDWFMEQFAGRELDKQLSLRTGLKGIAGSTFTAIAINGGVRRVLATHQTLNARTAGRH
ncbi:MAG: hypothetical protein CSA54_06305, partial [Gammaproteobacteria bacterium]